jgi:hypothetical protein
LSPKGKIMVNLRIYRRADLITSFSHYKKHPYLIISAGKLYRMPEGPGPVLQGTIVTLESQRFIDEDHAEFIDIAGFFHEHQKSGANFSGDVAIDAFPCLDTGCLCVQA